MAQPECAVTMEATFTSQALTTERRETQKSRRDREGVTAETVTDRLTDVKMAFPRLSSAARTPTDTRVMRRSDYDVGGFFFN